MSWRFWWEHPARLREVIVNTKAFPDRSIRGVLWENKGAWLVVKSAYAWERGAGEPTKIDGDVIFERSEIDFIQVLP